MMVQEWLFGSQKMDRRMVIHAPRALFTCRGISRVRYTVDATYFFFFSVFCARHVPHHFALTKSSTTTSRHYYIGLDAKISSLCVHCRRRCRYNTREKASNEQKSHN